MEQQILAKAQSWAKNPYFSQADRDELTTLLASEKGQRECIERFYKDLEFGTAGLRSITGFGSNRINIYTMRRAAQALVNAVIKTNPLSNIIALSFDSRLSSESFSREVAGVFAANGFKTIIANEPTPTPLLSYAVRYYHAAAGVMITASHNPKDYNGFKAYWNDGGQVTPPYDQQIIDEYNQLENWNAIKCMDFSSAKNKELIQFFDESFFQSYQQVIENEVLRPQLLKEHGADITISYTPLHGTGSMAIRPIAKHLGLKNLHIVPNQEKPDGNFPTTDSPNPENPEALREAEKYLKQIHGDLLIGSDPDTDRMGVAVTHQGKVVYLNGNQIAILMMYYKLMSLKEQGRLPAHPLVIKTIVTSDMQTIIAEDFGATMENTLTGFKWMAKSLKDKEDHGVDYGFIFASEESYGTMSHPNVRDKDGVSSAMLMSEIALYYKMQNKSLIDALDELYNQYGFHYESLLNLHYQGMEGEQKIIRIMEQFRNFKEGHFIDQQIAQIEDYARGIVIDASGKEISKLSTPSSNVLGFVFTSGNRVYMRPSGTEPKIKFYTQIRESEGSLDEKKSIAIEKAKIMEKFIEEFCEQA